MYFVDMVSRWRCTAIPFDREANENDSHFLQCFTLRSHLHCSSTRLSVVYRLTYNIRMFMIIASAIYGCSSSKTHIRLTRSRKQTSATKTMPFYGEWPARPTVTMHVDENDSVLMLRIRQREKPNDPRGARCYPIGEQCFPRYAFSKDRPPFSIIATTRSYRRCLCPGHQRQSVIGYGKHGITNVAHEYAFSRFRMVLSRRDGFDRVENRFRWYHRVLRYRTIT